MTLPEPYKTLIDRAEVVSFDVFDTLIHRSVQRPTDVFLVLAEKLKNHLFGLFNPGVATNFPMYRVHAEQEARKRLIAEIDSPEVNLNQIYKVFSEITGLSGSDVTTLMDLEIELEKQLCHPNPLMKQIYDYAHDQCKTVVLCSDMYLPSAVIEILLDLCGYKPPYRLLVSSDLGFSKHEGSIWDQVVARLDVKPNRIVHFGDNYHADVRTARQKGIRVHHFDYLTNSIEPRLRMVETGPDLGRHVRSLIQGTIRESLMIKKRDFWEDIGLQIFGALFLGYFLWFASLAKKDRLERILFFARDAYIPFYLYRKYGKQLGLTAEVEYTYFSRVALLLPSFVDMPLDRVWHLFSGRVHRTVEEHLSRLGIDPYAHLHMVLAVGFESVRDEVPNSDHRMFRLLNHLWNDVLLEAKRRRPLAARYVAELSGTAQRIGIVDIGWTGNMQGGFSRLLQLYRRDSEIIGYYFGTYDSVNVNILPRNTFRGYLMEQSQPAEWLNSLINGGVELLEFALIAPHGTTLGYELQNGVISPVLENNAADAEVRAHAQQIQRGAMDFIDTVFPRILDIGYENLLSSEWARPFYRLINEPTLEEATMLGDLTHSDSATDTTQRLHIAPKVPAEELDAAGLAKARERAFWKGGFDVRNRVGRPGVERAVVLPAAI